MDFLSCCCLWKCGFAQRSLLQSPWNLLADSMRSNLSLKTRVLFLHKVNMKRVRPFSLIMNPENYRDVSCGGIRARMIIAMRTANIPSCKGSLSRSLFILITFDSGLSAQFRSRYSRIYLENFWVSPTRGSHCLSWISFPTLKKAVD